MHVEQNDSANGTLHSEHAAEGAWVAPHSLHFIDGTLKRSNVSLHAGDSSWQKRHPKYELQHVAKDLHLRW